MRLSRLQRHWDEFGRRDPLWAILTSSDKKGNRWDIEEFFQTGRDDVAALMSYLASTKRTVARRRALDFGCGAGRLTQALAEYFEEVVGIDIAESMLDLARHHNRHGGRCRFILNDTEDLRKLDSNCFDLVYSRLVLQHMRPKYVRGYLAEMIRVLAPGGFLVFQLPSNEEPPVIGSGVKRFLPLWVVKLIRRSRRAVEAFPKMERYGMAPTTVAAILRDHAAVVLDVTRDCSHDEYTDGFQYCVTKRLSEHST